MWWGGSEGAEAATEAAEANPEMEDMKEQFEMQQNLIKQLKDMVKTHQTQLQEKEQQVQRLSVAGTEQSSQLASLSEQVAALEEDGAGPGGPAPPAGSQPRRQRLLEIKRQLEEQRRAQEERAREPRADITAMVRRLQERIEDPDYRYDSCDSAESGSDGEMELGTSPRKSMTLSDSIREKPPEELYGIILSKDNHIYELSDKVSQLEATVVDLKDTLQEKESVISARTAAVNLVTRALTERGQETMDTLDETRQQMRDMQEAFAVHEADWKVREEKLSRQLQTATDALETAEENYKKIEAAKFDLVIANANLQEKVVKLQASAKIEVGKSIHKPLHLRRWCFRVKSQKRQRLGQLEGETVQLSERCAQLEAELAERGDTTALEEERDRLQQESSERLAELTAVTKKLCDLERAQAEAEGQRAELEAAAEQLREQLRTKDAQLTELEQKSRLEVLATDLETARRRLRESHAECAAMQEETNRLQQAERELEEERHQLQGQVERLQTQLSGAEQQVAELQSGNKLLLEKLETEKGQHEQEHTPETIEVAGEQSQETLKKMVKKLKTKLQAGAEGEGGAGGKDRPPAAGPDQQKMKLMKAKLRKELQAKAELQKQLSEREATLEEVDKEAVLERNDAERAEREATLERITSELEEARSELAKHVASEASLESELQAQISSAETELAVRRPLSPGAQPAAAGDAAGRQSGGDWLGGSAVGSGRRRAAAGPLHAAHRGSTAAGAGLPAEPRDPFETLPPLRDRSSSQSSLMSERSESARSEPPGADGEREALLLKQQTRLKQLATAVRRRTAMRDEALARVKELEQEAQQMKARLEQLESAEQLQLAVVHEGQEDKIRYLLDELTSKEEALAAATERCAGLEVRTTALSAELRCVRCEAEAERAQSVDSGLLSALTEPLQRAGPARAADTALVA
ncbi:hypothetical protein FJT64_014359 [Amphibalanus amphitrite]|uniref:Uncharacterized protein n=1 Tax=Amphibalanus amphitrite TaxID=1232801 RepID=A0A6A4UZF5_AMPAM|nr:hypothetical protein FJT64_014359 [Amphibalanus amphitrite]